MKNYFRTAVVTAGLIAAVVGSGGQAAATVITPANAATAIHELQADGYRIILNKVGSEPLSLCHVTSVRRGRPITETVTVGGGDTVQKVVYTPVYVDVAP